jgi:hypothetical protein
MNCQPNLKKGHKAETVNRNSPKIKDGGRSNRTKRDDQIEDIPVPIDPKPFTQGFHRHSESPILPRNPSPTHPVNKVNPAVEYAIFIELRSHDELQISRILSFLIPNVNPIPPPHPTDGTIVTATPFDVGVLLISATDVTGTSAFASG